jgi:hypothetical protein
MSLNFPQPNFFANAKANKKFARGLISPPRISPDDIGSDLEFELQETQRPKYTVTGEEFYTNFFKDYENRYIDPLYFNQPSHFANLKVIIKTKDGTIIEGFLKEHGNHFEDPKKGSLTVITNNGEIIQVINDNISEITFDKNFFDRNLEPIWPLREEYKTQWEPSKFSRGPGMGGRKTQRYFKGAKKHHKKSKKHNKKSKKSKKHNKKHNKKQNKRTQKRQ